MIELVVDLIVPNIQKKMLNEDWQRNKKNPELILKKNIEPLLLLLFNLEL